MWRIGTTALLAARNVAASDTPPKRIHKATKNEHVRIRSAPPPYPNGYNPPG